MTLLDHALALLIVLIMPVVGFVSFQRLVRLVDSGEPINRTELYQTNTWVMWLLLLLTGALWLGTDRAWGLLGFRLDLDAWFFGSIAVTIIGVVILLMQVSKVKTAPIDEIRQSRNELGNLEIILPHNGNELSAFYGLSVSAGIVEESLWRGFVIWYLSAFMPLWAAALISVIAFGIAHAYQGISQIPKITLVGAVFTGLFFLSGSLWLPMILHAAVDILQGRAGYEIVRRSSVDNDNSGLPEDENLAASDPV